MRFKLDENLDVRLASLFADVGQEAKTVLDEGLSGRSDEAIYGRRGRTKPTDGYGEEESSESAWIEA